MSNEKFKVKFGLAVGDTAATIDATTGDIVTTGDITVGGNSIKSNGGNIAITLDNADVTCEATLTVDQGIFGNVFGTVSSLANHTTTDLAEGTNLYYTDARARAALSSGAGINYNSSTGVIASTITQYTDAMARAALSGGTGVTYNSSTGVIAIGQDVATTADVQFDDISATGNIKNTTQSIYAGSNRTFTGGNTTDITRNKGTAGTDPYNAYTGVLASNSDRTTTFGARGGMVIRSYGQNTTGGTTTTQGNPTLQYEASRGTPSVPVAQGSGDAPLLVNVHFNAGTTAGTAYWTNDNYTVAPTQLISANNQAASATAAAAATFVANFTTGTTMTVTSVTSGTISPKHELRYSSGGTGAFTTVNTFAIVGQLTSTAAAAATTTATGSNRDTKIVVASATGIVVGQLVIGTGIPTKTYVGSINGTTIRLVNVNGNAIPLTATITASAVNFYTPGGAGTYELNVSPYGVSQTAVTVTTTATTLGTNFLVRTQPDNYAMTGTSRPNSINIRPDSAIFQVQAADSTSSYLFNTWPGTMPGGTSKTLLGLGINASTISSERINFGSVNNSRNFANIVMPTDPNSTDPRLTANYSQVTTSGNIAPVITFAAQRSVDSINFTPTLAGDIIGSFKFNGNANTSTSPGVPAGPAAQIFGYATENFTSTATGGGFQFTGVKTGALTDVTLIDGNSVNTQFRSDAFTFRDSNSNTIAGGKIGYSRQYGSFFSNAAQTNPVANTVNPMTWNNTDIANGISIVSNSRITMSNAGQYNIQFSAQFTQAGGGSATAYIWLRKNGTSVPDSAADITLVGNNAKQLAAWNFVVDSAANDYFEIVWQAADTNVSMPYVAASGNVPGAPSTAVTITPVGA